MKSLKKIYDMKARLHTGETELRAWPTRQQDIEAFFGVIAQAGGRNCLPKKIDEDSFAGWSIAKRLGRMKRCEHSASKVESEV
jgi:hypothetical protein